MTEWLLVSALAVAVAAAAERCEEITIPMCRGIGYNHTQMPNRFHHDTQEEAGLEVHQFWPLVEIHCSDDLLFFLCSLYTPICIEDYKGRLPACRSVCERARAGCAPIMHKYGFAWPERMNCDDFPAYGDPERLCMDAREGEPPPQRSRKVPRPPPAPVASLPPAPAPPTPKLKGCECACEASPMGEEERAFASLWIGVCAALCCASASLTVLTFMIDPSRFRYPERPVVFLSGCYLMVSVGYLVPVGAGRDSVVSCGGERGPACTLVFVLVYFFGMASSLWWVVLTLTWLLAAGLRWGNEAIASCAQYFHFAAWVLPTAQCVTALALDAVDGDPVSGVCVVGVRHRRWLVVAPLLAYLLLGTGFLAAGFVSMFRIRRVIRTSRGALRADKLEKLMVRISVFSALYTVPAAIVVGCHLREADECPCRRPTFAMLKYFMCLAVGIASGFWITSVKTLDSWRRLCCRNKGAELPPRTFKPPPPSHV